jgi:acetyl-CoA carboxylase biotin carboxylase subunit
MFKKILIANRGEIAVRVMRTCREMGIATVAVYSETDRKALHTLEADEAIFLGASEPTASYLNQEKIIEAVQKTGAEAVHPGYGFLAENADFAARCQTEGIVFIGPSARVIRELGDKTVARGIMVKSGVPITPGMEKTETDIATLTQATEAIGFPVLVKAAAGGGGKGMRVVSTREEMDDACTRAAGEAQAAFGNGAIYVEKYLERPRHIEFQILADTHGNVVHLLERECSIQRRHQKIIEETPSPAMTPELRAEMGASAVAAARAAGYVNAGTVEFLLDTDNRFYFLEVNTRLQVEHPITELVTGIDLVREQIRVAAGKPLSITQADVAGRGHAIECRIYGEDPENDFMPSPGRIELLVEPTGPGVRNDCGVYTGAEVPVEYDPILSKLIVHAADREQAIARMQQALSNFVVLGVKTPIAFLMDILASDPFRQGQTFTDFIPTHFDGWQQPSDGRAMAALAYIVDEITASQRGQGSADRLVDLESPWRTLGNWQL